MHVMMRFTEHADAKGIHAVSFSLDLAMLLRFRTRTEYAMNDEDNVLYSLREHTQLRRWFWNR